MTKQLSASTDKIIAAFKAADDNGKKAFREIYGEDLFNFNAYEKIKKVEDACKVMGYSFAKMFSTAALKGLFPHEIANRKLAVISEAFNKLSGWKLNWDDGSQRKYYPWFDVIKKKNGFSGRGLSLDGVNCDCAYAGVGPRHYVGSESEAKYMANQFISLFEETTLIA